MTVLNLQLFASEKGLIAIKAQTMKIATLVILSLFFTLTAQAQSHPYGKNPEVGHMAEVNGISLYYEVYGDGEPLVLLHGNGGYSGARANMMDSLITHFRVITVDHRCHGQSGCTEELDYRLMASDINALLEHLEVDSAYVYGHSDGGIMGLIMGFQYPDKVKKLVVSGANIKRDSTALEPIIVRIMQQYKAIQNPKMQKQIKLMVEHPDLDFAELTGITAPTLIISGDRDAVRLAHTVKIFESIPNANLSVLPATTHFVSEEHPQLMLDHLMHFFKTPFQKPSTTDWAKKVAGQIMPGVKY